MKKMEEGREAGWNGPCFHAKRLHSRTMDRMRQLRTFATFALCILAVTIPLPCLSFTISTLPKSSLLCGGNARTSRQQTRKMEAKKKFTSRLETKRNEDTIGQICSDVVIPLTLLLASQFVLFVGVGAVIPTLPLYGKAIGLSSAANGVVISAPAVALLIGANSAGKFADVARKPAMIGGMALIAMSDIGTALASGLETLVLARIGLGAGRAVSEAGERGMLADLAGRVPSLRGRSLAAQQAVVALGIAIGAPAGGMVVEMYGPRASFLCVSAAALVAMFMYTFLPETICGRDRSLQSLGNAKKGAPSNPDFVKVPPEGDWGTLLTDRRWRGLALCQCGTSFGFAAKIASIPVLAASTLPGGAVGAGALLSAAGLSGLVGAPFGGWLTDRSGAVFTAVISGIVSATGLILIPLALQDSSWVTMIGDAVSTDGMTGQSVSFASLVLVWSLGAAAQGPAMTAIAQELAPDGAEATAMALPRAAGDGTYIAAPFILGIVADSVVGVPGLECSVAGVATLLGAIALTLSQ